MDIFDLTTDFLRKQKFQGKQKIYISAENIEILKNIGIALPQKKAVEDNIILESQPIIVKETAKPFFEITKNTIHEKEEIKTILPVNLEDQNSKISIITTGKNQNSEVSIITTGENQNSEISIITTGKNQNSEISIITTGKNQNSEILFIEETVKFIENQPPFFYGAETLQKMTENVIFVKWENVTTASLIKPQLSKNNFDLMAIETLLQNLIFNLKPKLIVVCSSLAAKALLKNFEPINKSHGILKFYRNIPIIEIFHPEYLNRFPQFKKLTMPDLKLIKKTLDEN